MSLDEIQGVNMIHLIESIEREEADPDSLCVKLPCMEREMGWAHWSINKRPLSEVNCPLCRESWEYVEQDLSHDGNPGAKIVSTFPY